MLKQKHIGPKQEEISREHFLLYQRNTFFNLKSQIKEFRFNTYHKQYLSDPIHSSIIQFKQLETCIINIEVYVDIHLYITPNIGGAKYIY